MFNMKKLLFALVLGLLLIAALASVAMADNGPHGGFTATTDACANCHRVHTAQFGSNSLLIMDPEALCVSCHDGSGAGTNVEDGVYSQAGRITSGAAANEGNDGASLFGGGFVNALMAHTWSGAATANPAFNAVSEATTSSHGISAVGTVWGSGANNSVNGSMLLECTSCHDPHGNSGRTNTGTTNTGWLTNGCDPSKTAANPCTTKVGSYRLLRWQPSGSDGFTTVGASVNWSGGTFPSNTSTTGWTVPDNYATLNTEWYTIGTVSAFAVGDYSAGNGANVYNVSVATGRNYTAAAINTAFFCAQCHDRYFNNSRLRNNTDYSAYCYAATTMPVYSSASPFGSYNGVNNPTSLADVSTVDAAYCVAAASTSSTTGFLWGDSRPSGDNTYMYRHASGDIRASVDGTNAAGAGTSLSRSCMACHVSHGTTAAMTTAIAQDDLTADSALLRMDNRSQCLRCHANGINYTIAP